VRIFLEGDPQAVGEAVVPWADADVVVDRSRLTAGAKLVASQQLGSETSDRAPKGQLIEGAINGPVNFPETLYWCAQSLSLAGCSPGARLEVWQHGTMLGSGEAVGEEAWVDFSQGNYLWDRVVAVDQIICTSATPIRTIIRVHPIRHDRAKEHGAFATRNGRPRHRQDAPAGAGVKAKPLRGRPTGRALTPTP
jgi:hypothetical protein